MFLALLFISSLYAQTPPASGDNIDYGRLSERFVTSVKEAQVDNLFGGTQEVGECVQNFPLPSDMTNIDNVRKAQRDQRECMRAKLQQVDPTRLETLSRELQLEAFGVVKGKSNKALIDYLSNRMETILYGNVNGTVKPLRDQRLVDQRTYVDIYESQLGKNILLELSNYCYEGLQVGSNRSSRLSELASFSMSNVVTAIKGGASVTPIVPSITDTRSPPSTTTPQPSVYDSIQSDLKSIISSPDPNMAKSKLNSLFNNCVQILPKLCEYYQNCLCEYNRLISAGKSPACNPVTSNLTCPTPTTGSAAPKNGQLSCHVLSRVRGYRTNLEALTTVKEQFDEIRSSNTDKGFNPNSGVYNSNTADSNETIDELTSIKSSEADEALEVAGADTDAEAVTQECVNRPEDINCAKFFYSADETARFAQASAKFNAATLVESQKIKNLSSDKESLKNYLNNRGYFDLAEEADTGDLNVVVSKAQSRFEAEREASFNEMNLAFERQQLTTTTTTESLSQAQRVDLQKQEFQTRGDDFKRLVFFNNIVSGYLDLQKRNAQGNLESAGLNVKAYQREVEGLRNDPGATSALSYFEGLQSTDQSQITNEAPLVDINFLNAILGNSSAEQEERNRGRR